VVNEENLFRLALNEARHALSMAGAESKGFEDEQVEGALQQGNAVIVIFLGSHPTQVNTSLGRMSTRKKNGSD
jgi:hypothetical protein